MLDVVITGLLILRVFAFFFVMRVLCCAEHVVSA